MMYMLRHISEIFQICVYYLRPSPMIVHESITSHTEGPALTAKHEILNS